MSVRTGPPPSASEGPPGSSAGGLDRSPVQGIKQAHTDMVAWLYKSHGAAADEQLKKVDAAGVKREHIAYGFIGLTSLYLLSGEEAMFVSNLITFLYPAAVSVDVIRSKKSGEAIGQLQYWVPFGFFALLDSTSFSLIPAYFLLRTAFLIFLFLPQTQGAQLIFNKVIEPIAKAVDGFTKKKA
ncbi:hypothetical protein RB195_010369 [Necator americanus]|uniref:Uncharacterized protein n=2 Tax=Necator americanus TaxID=51031 RepID=A0ABR1CXL9_NECAM|nr:TB2/DP1, HVA22 family [Necator americanus]ETN78441.1 TB2/DP1, HVA22 family [Necator americanus]